MRIHRLLRSAPAAIAVALAAVWGRVGCTGARGEAGRGGDTEDDHCAGTESAGRIR